MTTLELKEDIFKIISETSKKLGIESYVIGGYVRDYFLHRPSKDIDIVTNKDAINLAEELSKILIPNPKVTIFKNFGTAHFKYKDLEVEFVAARKESYTENSRNPSVENGTLLDDILRRDFTINTLSVSLNKENYGEIIDKVGGISNLTNSIIKTPTDPDKTFIDDPLRMLRAIRFATQLNFQIENNTLESISKNVERIKIISKERITDELNKIILSPIPSIGFKLLKKTKILDIIFPEFLKLDDVEKKGNFQHKNNFYHTLEVLDNLSKNTDDLWLRWSAVLHDIGKPQTKKFDPKIGWTFHGHDFLGSKMVSRIFNKLKLPKNEKMKFVEKMVLLHLRPIGLSKVEVTDSGIRRLLFDAGNDINSLMLLCEADITSKNEYKVKKFLDNFNLVRKRLAEVEEIDRIKNFKPPIDGKAIMEYFNIKPGNHVGIIKNAIKDAILDGIIKNEYEECFNFMKKKGIELGLEVKK